MCHGSLSAGSAEELCLGIQSQLHLGASLGVEWLSKEGAWLAVEPDLSTLPAKAKVRVSRR